MTRTVDDKKSDAWYLDFCVSRHICNSRDKFTDFRAKTYEFVTARETWSDQSKWELSYYPSKTAQSWPSPMLPMLWGMTPTSSLWISYKRSEFHTTITPNVWYWNKSVLKLAGRNSDIYKMTLEGNSSIPPSKTSARRKALPTGYAASYMHKDNGIAKWCWRTWATIKDLLLINSTLLVNFRAEVMNTANYLCNWLPTRCGGPFFIPKKVLTNTRPNLEYLGIFNWAHSYPTKSLRNRMCKRLERAFSLATREHLSI